MPPSLSPAPWREDAAEAREPSLAPVFPTSLDWALLQWLCYRALTRPRVAVSVSAASVVLLVLVGAGAPNNNTLGMAFPLPLLGPMSALVSTTVTTAAVLLSGLGLVGLLGAHSSGWRPSPRRLFAAGAVTVAVITNLTPVGSSDTASYAAYGRIAALGRDPYVITPGQLGGDYAHLVSHTWLATASVYGPVATWLQAAAAQIGGHRPWLTVWLLMLANGAAFLATGYVLIRTAADPVRAGLLWVANPLLMVVLVAGGHLDTIVAALAVCAVHCARNYARPRDDLIVGVLVGLACSIKISAALLGIALLWPLLRERAWGRVARQGLSGAFVLAAGYSWYGTHALAPLSAASHLVAMPSLWWVVQKLGQVTIGRIGTSAAIGIVWPVLALALAWLIHRRMSPKAPPSVAVFIALTFAWILAAPWSMPWYSAVVWVMVALLPRCSMVRWLILTTTALALVHDSVGHDWSWLG
jgi:hypothetical protein